ncbi:hypothetical protein NUW58_g5129 [Xylaria curta]|uniref:Uncharacterized protein n=1 Tax=Xylaria curta TaxID=42375 RepID=A0ACC1P634_9PEZI|nr:hypothetical protein NUW58_g5129 [Xylaria curta]
MAQGEIKEMTPELWKAKKIVDSTIHPDTGEPVLLPFRMSCFALSNLVVTAGMLTPGLSNTGTILWQIANQSLNVAINNANANKSTPLSYSKIAQSYFLAVGASCSVAVGLNSLVPRLKRVSPSTKLILGRLVPFAAVASAGFLNVFLMRGEEMRVGHHELRQRRGAEPDGDGREPAALATQRVRRLTPRASSATSAPRAPTINAVITNCLATGAEGSAYTAVVNSLATHTGPLCAATGAPNATITTGSPSPTSSGANGGASSSIPTGAAPHPTAFFGGAAAAIGVLAFGRTGSLAILDDLGEDPGEEDSIGEPLPAELRDEGHDDFSLMEGEDEDESQEAQNRDDARNNCDGEGVAEIAHCPTGAVSTNRDTSSELSGSPLVWFWDKGPNSEPKGPRGLFGVCVLRQWPIVGLWALTKERFARGTVVGCDGFEWAGVADVETIRSHSSTIKPAEEPQQQSQEAQHLHSLSNLQPSFCLPNKTNFQNADLFRRYRWLPRRAVSAIPTDGGNNYAACGVDGLYSAPQCCATDVLGVADLNCHSPSQVPFNVNNFRDICANGGQRARCCIIPILGQALLCKTPTGLGEQ